MRPQGSEERALCSTVQAFVRNKRKEHSLPLAPNDAPRIEKLLNDASLILKPQVLTLKTKHARHPEKCFFRV